MQTFFADITTEIKKYGNEKIYVYIQRKRKLKGELV
jgi:hypothetical protein